MSRKIYDLTARCGCCRRLRLQFFLAMGGRLCYNSVRWKPHPPACAGMMELADVTDSKSVGSDTVWVQVPLPAPRRSKVRFAPTSFCAHGKKTSSARSLAPPFQIEPTSLGFDLVLGANPEVSASILLRCSMLVASSISLATTFSFHCKTHRALILLLLLSKPQPLTPDCDLVLGCRTES